MADAMSARNANRPRQAILAVIVLACSSGMVWGRLGDEPSMHSGSVALDAFEEPPEKVHLAVCSDNEREDKVQMFMRRARPMGYTLHWLNCSTAFPKGKKPLWGARLQKYKEWVEKMPDDALVVFADGFDAIAEGSALEAATRFNEFGTPLVFSCLTYPYPLDCPAYQKYHKEGKCSYPCGGAYMGRAVNLRSLYNSGPAYDERTDDQCWLYAALHSTLKAGQDYSLDDKSRIFLSYTTNLAWRLPYSMEKGRHVLDVAGIDRRPTFIHLDTSSPSIMQMKRLYACQPGSEAPQCNVQAAGWWPEPSAGKVMYQLTSVLALPLALVVGLFIGRQFRQRKSDSEKF